MKDIPDECYWQVRLTSKQLAALNRGKSVKSNVTQIHPPLSAQPERPAKGEKS